MNPKELAARARQPARQLPSQLSEATSIALQRPLCEPQNQAGGCGENLPAVIQVLDQVAASAHREGAVKGM